MKLLKRILLVQDWIRKTSNNIEEGAMLHCAFLHLQPLPPILPKIPQKHIDDLRSIQYLHFIFGTRIPAVSRVKVPQDNIVVHSFEFDEVCSRSWQEAPLRLIGGCSDFEVCP
ncbi:hypothetical protein ASG33_02535 [Dyadobacter sp. Leaf189]|nr:hypothetical protein ASG33_02535 [Dyadobacter sp. Leaf189]